MNSMMSAKSLIVFLVVLSSSVINEISACSCVYSHPQEHFCSSDFVATVMFKGEGKEIASSLHVYPIKVQKIFKSTSPDVFTKGLLYTPSQANSCTPTIIHPNKNYLIAGRLVNKKPFISLCNFIEPYSSLTLRQKKGFRRNYGLHCDCKVRDIYLMASRYEDRETESALTASKFNSGFCSWDTKWSIENDCQGMHGACIKVKPKALRRRTRSYSFRAISPKGHLNEISSYYQRRNGYTLCQWEENQDYLRCLQRVRNQTDVEREGLP